ncbi:MAG: recombinase family protein [Oscillospiraceae bacterium]|jgi:DNA invertase Pin-like site-specific DNA recombinase|nr:recombinase family protein [Oscillospiraceae bacterium]
MNEDKTPKATALYIRVASPTQLEESEQKERLMQYAKQQGIPDVEVYEDYGYSGLNMNRPAFRKLREDIESGKIGKVITADIGRISRDWMQAHGFMNILKMNGAGIDTLNKSHEKAAGDIPAAFLGRNHEEPER